MESHRPVTPAHPLRPGAETSPARRQQARRRRLALGLALLVLVVAAVLSIYALLTARHSLLQGRQDLDAAQAVFRGLSHSSQIPASLATARSDVASARSEFDHAATWLGPLSPLLDHLSWVPRVGDQLAAASPLADAGRDASDGILAVLDGAEPVTRSFPQGGHGSHLSTPLLLSRLAAGRPQFDRACSLFRDAASARAQVHTISSATVRNALQTFDQRLPGLRALCGFLAHAPAMLGYPQPRSYLLAYQDPLELRPTGGFIGSAGIIHLRDGRIQQRFGDTGLIKDNYSVPSPEPMHLYNVEPFWLFRDANWSPDFPTSAALERFFLRLDMHRDVKGVIDVTPAAAAAVLAATGPLFLPEYGRTVTSANVAQLADYYTHWAGVPGPGSVENRKQFIQIMGSHLFSRLAQASLGTWLKLAQSLSSVVASRDLLLNLANGAEQEVVRTAGASGGMDPTTGDYLYVVDSNLSYNKINPYVHERVTYSVTVRPDRWLLSRLTLHFTNTTPQALAVHGIGPGGGRLGGPIDYADFVRVYAPAGSQLLDQSGWTQPWSPGPAYGKMLFPGYLIVPHGQSRTVHLEYVTPPNVFRPSDGARYHLVVQHQPGLSLDRLRIRVRGVTSGTATVTVENPKSDITLDEPIERRPYRPVPLPQQPPTVVAPGHWIEPHVYLAPPQP